MKIKFSDAGFDAYLTPLLEVDI